MYMRRLLISVGLVVCLLMAFVLPMCAPAPPVEEEAPPVEEEAPPVEPGPYEKYVASLPEGCEPVPRECFEQAMEEGELYELNWAAWWPQELYDDFAKEFGVKVIQDPYGSTPEVTTKFTLNPDIQYDMTCLSPPAFIQIKQAGAFQEINHDWIPNVNKFLTEDAKNLEENPNYKYAIPTCYCLFGYLYNTKYVDDPRIPSWGALLEPDEKYAGRISMRADIVLTVGAALKYLGYSWNSVDEEELMEARELLLRQKPFLMTYDDYPKRLVLEEELWMSQESSGDAYARCKELEGLKYAMPTEGTVLNYQMNPIPKGSRNPAMAHLWLNYLFRPERSALLAEWTAFGVPHKAAVELLPEELREFIAPPEEYLALCESTTTEILTGKGWDLRDAILMELKK